LLIGLIAVSTRRVDEACHGYNIALGTIHRLERNAFA
jgi:hypothetical protein